MGAYPFVRMRETTSAGACHVKSGKYGNNFALNMINSPDSGGLAGIL
jgi:hypothetical protein